MLRLIIQTKKKYKLIEKQDIEPNEENGKVDITEICSTDDESGDGQSTKTQDDVDSEVTFEDDPDEEMDTTTIEEEDWIDYIKRSTVDALDKMEHATRCKYKLSLTVCICTTCQRASFNSTTDSFSWGHDPYTLACKGLHSTDVGLL